MPRRRRRSQTLARAQAGHRLAARGDRQSGHHVSVVRVDPHDAASRGVVHAAGCRRRHRRPPRTSPATRRMAPTGRRRLETACSTRGRRPGLLRAVLVGRPVAGFAGSGALTSGETRFDALAWRRGPRVDRELRSLGDPGRGGLVNSREVASATRHGIEPSGGRRSRRCRSSCGLDATAGGPVCFDIDWARLALGISGVWRGPAGESSCGASGSDASRRGGRTASLGEMVRRAIRAATDSSSSPICAIQAGRPKSAWRLSGSPFESPLACEQLGVDSCSRCGTAAPDERDLGLAGRSSSSSTDRGHGRWPGLGGVSLSDPGGSSIGPRDIRRTPLPEPETPADRPEDRPVSKMTEVSDADVERVRREL